MNPCKKAGASSADAGKATLQPPHRDRKHRQTGVTTGTQTAGTVMKELIDRLTGLENRVSTVH